MVFLKFVGGGGFGAESTNAENRCHKNAVQVHL